MTSTGRAILVSAFLALVATGIAAFVVYRGPEEEALADAGPVGDASPDGSAKVAKKPDKKKPAPRSGKPRVAGKTTRVAGPPHVAAPHPSGGAHAASGHDQHGGHAAAPHSAHGHHVSPSGSSYESALDSNNQHVTIGAHAGPDLTDAQLHGPMSNAAFISDCGAPDDMGVTVKVAIRMGHAVGVSVSTNPPSAEVAGCIDHHVRGLTWPASAKMDSFVTTY